MSQRYPGRPSTVLFDLDGTLIDTAPDFIWCLNTQRARYDRPPLPDAAIRAVVSNGARALVRLGFELEPEDPGFDQYHRELLDLYESRLAVDTVLFPGLGQLLSRLEEDGIPWGIVTNKPVRFAAPLIVALGLAERCSTLICPDHVTERKPHPEPLYLACQRIGAVPTKAIYVGDHERDIEAGRNAGMRTIAVRYGYIEQPESVELWQADVIADTVADLSKLLQ